ncbi:MAG: hypothetical protein UX33_C0011G0004 [Candidatus Azambacteria bacterium GW2011_GWC1_46_13]|uniref:Uncharacterized protein n=1 Tax=Candidatus Azambacteria bacterium GW2011_GWC1_46_13 TaxID=1618619 RepID=A0A0G1NP61_9BACT|nr:MAG: hypothetical protein UX33_C0011G0004 [Candidatus Azambacteria bacterium GW2011_GWC1_46_13]
MLLLYVKGKVKSRINFAHNQVICGIKNDRLKAVIFAGEPVSRILWSPKATDDHLSGPAIARGLKRATFRHPAEAGWFALAPDRVCRRLSSPIRKRYSSLKRNTILLFTFRPVETGLVSSLWHFPWAWLLKNFCLKNKTFLEVTPGCR